jgi:hypothetical protein
MGAYNCFTHVNISIVCLDHFFLFLLLLETSSLSCLGGNSLAHLLRYLLFLVFFSVIIGLLLVKFFLFSCKIRQVQQYTVH